MEAYSFMYLYMYTCMCAYVTISEKKIGVCLQIF